MIKKQTFRVLIINPGSTSDEVAVVDYPLNRRIQEVIRYTDYELGLFEGKSILEQLPFRKKAVVDFLSRNDISLRTVDSIVARGGLIAPVSSGTYRINSKMLQDLKEGKQGQHPSNLAAIIATELITDRPIERFIADPVVVDEMASIARYSGMPNNPRISIFHALNQKQVARKTALKIEKCYENASIIVIHAGGGISVGLHHNGKVVDVNNALNGEGALTPRRAGTVPAGKLVEMCFSGTYSKEEIGLKLKGKGGLSAYTGTTDLQLLKRFIKGEDLTTAERKILLPTVTPKQVAEIIEAMVYQISKEVCALTAFIKKAPDAIALTGGLAFEDELIVAPLKERVQWMAPFFVFPGSDEVEALYQAGLDVLTGKNIPLTYG